MIKKSIGHFITEMSSVNLTAGTKLFNRKYQIENKLGTGTFCTVYADKNSTTAIKIYTDDENTKYYSNELRALIQITGTSRHVMQLLDYFSHITFTDAKIQIYLCIAVPKYTKTLDAILHEHDSGLSLVVSKNILKQILFGLDCLHRNGIVYADLKPDNIMFVDDCADLSKTTAVLTDFNHAVFTSDDYFPTTGTQEYCSPEQMLKMAYSHSSDIWSLGCVFYEMNTSRQLFALDDSDDESSSYASPIGSLTSSSSTQSLGELFDELSDETIAEYRLNYDHFVCIYQLLGKPPQNIITRANHYFTSNGLLAFNPTTTQLNLVNILVENFEKSAECAAEIARVALQMIKYDPAQRPTSGDLIAEL